MRPLINAVLFNGEFDLLEFRFNYLLAHVDFIVIGESALSFSGKRKKRHFLETKDRFSQHDLSRVEYFQYDLPTSGSRWNRERIANRQLVDFSLQLRPNAAVLVCDADEFPSAEQCAIARRANEPMSIPMTTYYRRADWRVQYSEHLPMGVLVQAPATALDIPGEGMHQRSLPPLGGERGSHFSYIGFTDMDLAEKYSSFSHDELDFEASHDSRLLRLADHYGVDHLGRPLWRGGGVLDFVPQEEWSTTQLALYDSNPSAFAQGPVDENRFTRLAAAVLIDMVVNRRSEEWAMLLPSDPQRMWNNLDIRHRAYLALITALTTLGRLGHDALRPLGRFVRRTLKAC